MLWPSRCVFLVLLGCSTGGLGPTLLDAGFLYWILSASSLDPKLHRGSRGPPSVWCGFPYHNSSPTLWNSTGNSDFLLDSNSTELYNGSTPTRSSKSHVWSSSSGNNCHAIHWSVSSGASVYECTMGIFSSSHFISQFPPTRFPLLTAIRMCHLLPVHHLGMAFLAGSKGQNTTYIPD